MIINTKGIEVKDSVDFINKSGIFLGKITKWALDGHNNNGDLKFKIFFQCVENGTTEPFYMHSEAFSVASNMLWKIKMLETAIKAPEIYNLDDFVGRYVIMNIKEEKYENSTKSGVSYKIRKYEYSPLNDRLEPIPAAVENSDDNEDDPLPF